MTIVDAFEAVPLGLASVLRARGFEQLTAVQSAVLLPENAGSDLRISSQTGSGKTIALGFVLAQSVHGFVAEGSRRAAVPVAVIVAPTRELAGQLSRELSWLYEPLGARVRAVTGGTSVREEQAALADNPALVVGTPGRLLDHLRRGNVQFTKLEALVLDEADEMLDMGFEEELDAILTFAPATRRTHLVSATFGPHVERMANRIQSAPRVVRGTELGKANSDIEHSQIRIALADRIPALINLLLRHPEDKTLVFVRTRTDTQQVAQALRDRGFTVRALSGDMTHRERTEAFAEFRGDNLRILVATDVAARGLDVDNIARVIQYDLPTNADVLTHRAGRTGRAGKRGHNVLFVPPRVREKATAMARRAGVQLMTLGVPTRDEIRVAADERLLAWVDGANPTTDARELATRLLEGREPAEVLAAIVGRLDYKGPCEPFAVNAQAEPKARATAPTRDPHASKGFTLFYVSWGSKNGADARRLLALACRRGSVSKSAVGAIRITPRSSVIEVDSSLAAEFELAAQRPDPRDPRVRFRRFSTSPETQRAQAGPRRKSGRPWFRSAG